MANTAAVERDPRWALVVARSEGPFVYAVRTTGVYCRPSCGARRPRPENVEFHATPAAAERAGFRACRRCRPDRTAAGAELVAALCRRIATAERPPSLAELAGQAGLSPARTRRLFRDATGVTPRAFAAEVRAGRLRASLEDSPDVTRAVHAAGHGSAARFYAQAGAVLGMTPTEWRAGAPGIRIRFAVGACSLGSVLVAATGRGTCAIALGDDPEELVRDLERRFAGAELVAGDRAFSKHVARVVGLVERPGRAGAALPLDVRGTAFQRRVWEALRAVPPGGTVSYAELARRLGLPNGARAVAGACAANPAAVAIPCHRVVRSDGGLGGYRWGIDRKRALLAREGHPASATPDASRPSPTSSP